MAANALAIVARELEQRPEAVEQTALATLVGEAELGEQRRMLCEEVRAGRLSATADVLAALTPGIVARLMVDNPRYATLERLSRTAS